MATRKAKTKKGKFFQLDLQIDTQAVLCMCAAKTDGKKRLEKLYTG